jgi:glycosyltransferase involved in cell wall biosynthesis
MTATAPRVSVCVPVFNGEAFLRAALDSVLVQSFSDFELLVADNCSTDGTAAIATGTGDPRVRHFRHDRNIGSIANFNSCVERAAGEFFVLLPADDLLCAGSLEALVRALDDAPAAGFAYGGFERVDAAGRGMETILDHRRDRAFSPEATIADVVEHFNPIQLPMARTAILRTLGGFDRSFGCFCDIHLWMRIAFAGWESRYVARTISCLRVHDAQGQNQFKQPTRESVSKLSEHYGQALDRSFFVANHYNHLFLEIIRFTLAGLQARGQDDQGVRKKLLQMLASSQIRNVARSAAHLNGFMLRQEIAVLGAVARWRGWAETARSYGGTAVQELPRWISARLRPRAEAARS